MPTILGANSVSGDFITNSLRLNDDDTPRLARTPSTAGNRRTFSISFWQKKGNTDHDNDYIISLTGNDDATNFEVSNHTSQAFQIGLYSVNLIRTNRLFRDPSAWTHYFFFIDTTQASESNRFQLYINGVQETSFAQTNIPSQNADIGLGRDAATYFFSQANNANSIDAYISDFHYIDGIKKAHTDFGETNSNGVWVPIEYEGNYGDQGIHLEFKQTGTSANASGIGADTSGNGNHLTPTNLAATDVSTDTPQNNFTVFRPHSFPQDSRSVLSEGNLDFDFTGDGNVSGRRLSAHVVSNIGVTQGKWYAEFKLTEDANGGFIGVSNLSNKIYTGDIESYNYLYTDNGNKYVREKTGEDESNAAHGAAVSVNDIVQVALDADNRNVYFGKGGSWASGSGAWNQATPTSAVSYTADFVTTDSHGVVVFNAASAGSSETPRWQANFGSPPFAISSGNSDAAGHGNFEYAVPSGYFALCTKNLAEYG